MSKTISFPISTYIDFKTSVTTITQDVPQHLGAITKISVNPANVLTNGQSSDLEAFVRHFRYWKYSGTKVAVVPVARAPVDPAHMTYSASMPSIDPFDLTLFHAWKRWTNKPQTVPQNGVDAYFLMDRTWKTCSVLRGFSLFARPFVSRMGYTVPCNPFTITGGPTQFDPNGLSADTSEPQYKTQYGQPRQTVDYETQYGVSTAPGSITITSTSANLDNHRHNFQQINDGLVDLASGSIRCSIETPAPTVLGTLKSVITGENTTEDALVRLHSRQNCRNWASNPGGVDQANLTGQVATTAKEPNKPEGSPSGVENWGTTTVHNHDVTLSQAELTTLADEHYHIISGQEMDAAFQNHDHAINARHLAQNLVFDYVPPNDNTAPWWQADTHAVTFGSRRMTGWQDTRVVDFGGSAVSTHIRSPTFPVMLWRIPKHWHTTYTFRLWMKHYFALRSPITHEIYTGSGNLAADLCEEYETELRKPSLAVGNFEVVDPADAEWLKGIIDNADKASMAPAEEEFVTI